MQTYVSANETTRTILVIILFVIAHKELLSYNSFVFSLFLNARVIAQEGSNRVELV